MTYNRQIYTILLNDADNHCWNIAINRATSVISKLGRLSPFSFLTILLLKLLSNFIVSGVKFFFVCKIA